MKRGLLFLSLCLALLVVCLAQDDFWNNVNVVEHEAESNVDRSVVDNYEPTETEPVIVDNTGFEDIEGVEKAKPKPKEKKPKKQPQQPQSTQFLSFPEQEHFYIEFAALGAIGLHLVFYLIGSMANRSIVTKFAEEFDELFEKQFSSVERDGIQFEKIAQYLYRAWVTGRVGCDGMMITISTLYRHDFITRLFDMFTNTTDTITFDIKVDPLLAQKVILSIQPKADKAAHLEANHDVRHFAPTQFVTPKQHLVLPSNRIIFTDTPEIVQPFMEKKQDSILQRVFDVLKENEALFVGLHVSDEFPDHLNGACDKRVIQLVCKLPSNLKKIEPLAKLALDLIDVFTTELKIHSKIQERNKKYREERLQKLREDKEKKEAEEKGEKKDDKKTKKKDVKKSK